MGDSVGIMRQFAIFASQAAFDTAHAAAKLIAGLPRVGRVNGKLAPKNQQTVELTSWHPHRTDGTVMAETGKGWPESKKEGFAFKTRAEVSNYFPEEE